MRLGIRDHKAIRAFVNQEPFEGLKLSTDGRSLDGHWLGGSRIAEWTRHGIRLNDKGSRAADYVHKQIKYHAAPVQIAKRDPTLSKRDSEGPHADFGHAKRIAHAQAQRDKAPCLVVHRPGGYYYVVPKRYFRGHVKGYPASVVHTVGMPPPPKRDRRQHRLRHLTSKRARDPESFDRAYNGLSRRGKDYLNEFASGTSRADLVAAWQRVPEKDRGAIHFLTEGERPNYERVESMIASEYGDD